MISHSEKVTLTDVWGIDLEGGGGGGIWGAQLTNLGGRTDGDLEKDGSSGGISFPETEARIDFWR